MRTLYAGLLAASFFAASCEETQTASDKELIVTLSSEIATLSDENQNLLRDIPIKQRASDTLLHILSGVKDDMVKGILVKNINTIQLLVDESKNKVSANASALRVKSLQLKRITTGDQQIVLADSVTKVAIAQSDTMIRLVASDTTVK